MIGDQMDLFGGCRVEPPEQASLSREIEARDRGMELAADLGESHLETCRALARMIARKRNGYCSIVEVREAAGWKGLDIVWGNWVGSIFKEACWKPAGFQPTKHKGSHARVVRVWRLEE